MPVYVEISKLHRTVTIVARGKITPDEVRGVVQQLADANVRSFAKIVEGAGAHTEWTPEQVVRIAALLRGDVSEKRGPVAFIVDPNRGEFARAFAEHTQGEGPISLFKGLREARDWLARIQHAPANPAVLQDNEQTPWSDPEREGVLIRGERQRGVRIRSLDAA